jgi:hypothetical protein
MPQRKDQEWNTYVNPILRDVDRAVNWGDAIHFTTVQSKFVPYTYVNSLMSKVLHVSILKCV